jgi:hypothetical protein
MVGFKLKIYKILPLNLFLKRLFLLYDEKTMQAMLVVLSVRFEVTLLANERTRFGGLKKPRGMMFNTKINGYLGKDGGTVLSVAEKSAGSLERAVPIAVGTSS